MKTNSLLSVIVSCYNQTLRLAEPQKSILEQKCTNWEYIIVKDGSPDNTLEVTLAWTKKRHEVHLYIQMKTEVHPLPEIVEFKHQIENMYYYYMQMIVFNTNILKRN